MNSRFHLRGQLRGQKSLTFRLTLLFTSLSTIVLLLLGLLIGSLVERHFEELDMELLGGKLELLRHTLAQVHSSQELATLPQQLDAALIGHHGMAVMLLKPDGQPLYASVGAQFPPQLLATADEEILLPVRWNSPEHRPYRGIAVRTSTGIPGQMPVVVAISTDMSHHAHFMHSFTTTLWLVVGLAALLTGLLGWLAARRGLAPLREISRSAAGITAQRLDQRLEVTAIPIELAEVTTNLNTMLARLEASFSRLSDFSSDLAHELRTPVSNLLTQTQVTLTKVRTLSEYQDVLASNAEEFERLSRMIADMLFLAKSDHHLSIPQQEKVDLAAEASSLLEYYEALAEEKGLHLSRTGHGIVFGDRLMLRRAISNLLSNAIRHTPEQGRVTVQVENTDHAWIILTVENTGTAIAAEHLPRLFDRFYRVDAARQRFGEGAGLGLAITRSIVHAHGGEVTVMSAAGVTRFEIRLPRGEPRQTNPM